MKNQKTLFSMIILSVFFCSTILLLNGCNSQEKVTDINGGFEQKSAMFFEPDGWYATRLPNTKDMVEFAWDSTEKHSGIYSVSIEIDTSHIQERIAYNWTRIYPDFEVGETYTLTGWVKARDLNGSAFIVVQCWGDNSKFIKLFTTEFESPVLGTKDWTMVKTVITVPEETIELRIRAGIATPQNIGGKVWFDDIVIE